MTASEELSSATPAHDAAETLRRITACLAAWEHPIDALREITDGLVTQAGAATCVFSLLIHDRECDYCRQHPPANPSPVPRLHRISLASIAGFRFDPALHILPADLLFTSQAAETRGLMHVSPLIGPYRERLIEAGFSPDTHPHYQELIRQGIQTGLFIPMLLRGELVGVLSLLFRRTLLPDEVRYLEIFTMQVAASIRAAQLLEEVTELRHRLEDENAYLQHAVAEEGGFAGIVGQSAALRAVLRLVRQVAPSETTVLLAGETGTGKELIARAIHAGSPRAAHPLIKVNCGAISPSLVESELFGHEKGAFTGALQRRLGRFELADRGSLFLDEVGELAAETQVKLLRVLQEREFERVGGERPVRVDVRVIAATHRDVPAEVAAGRFRADLFYRLNVFPITIPPLRERREDIPVLAVHFLAHFARALNKPLTGITREGLDRLSAYDWPGNIRELQNVIERACVLASGPRVDIPPLAAGSPAAAPAENGQDDLTLAAVERAHILRVLESALWRIEGPKGAAAILGLRPSTLRSRLERFGIRRDPRG